MNTRILRFLLFVSLVFVTLPSALRAQPCECTNCPVPIQDNGTFQGLLDVTVSGPNNLFQCPLQQVCFEIQHTWVGDLCVTLTSPGGLNYMVMADINNNSGGCGTNSDNINVCIDIGTGNPLTNNTEYLCNGPPNLCLVGNWTMPCGGVTDPITNAQEAPGCDLNAFNLPGQPANGTWVLTVNDICAQDVGFLINWSLTFACGVQDCFTCEADAGTINQPNVTGCIGSPSLNLNVIPQYTAPATPPPPGEYGYVWVVSSNGIITNFLTGGPNLNTLPPGSYQICGLSYLLDQGMPYLLYLGQPYNNLVNALNSGSPPFCGDLSNCFLATTGPPIPPAVMTMSMCYGDCFTTPLGTQCCNAGLCSYTLPSWLGCDSVTNIFITLIPPDITPITQTLCPGECLTINGVEYCPPGGYTIPYLGSDGCDSTVVLTLYAVPVFSIIGPPPTITCSNPVVTLNGSGSVGNTFQWTNANGVILGTAPTLQVNQVGCYNLTVWNTLNGVTCSSVSTACVTANQVLPGAPVIQGLSSVCAGQSATYAISPVPNATTYNWTLPPGATLITGANSTSITVNWTGPLGGDICVVALNNCGPGPVVCFPVTLTNAPGLPVIAGVDEVCPNDIETYTATVTANTTGYNWAVPPGATITGGQGTSEITVNWGNSAGGNICLTASNSCGAGPQACFNVIAGALPANPVVSGPPSVCTSDTIIYSVALDSLATSYTWTVPACAQIISGQGTNAIAVIWDNSCSQGNICVVANNDCGSTSQACLNVSVTDLPGLVIFDGWAAPCENAEETYITSPVPGVTNYIWTVTGGTILSGQGSTFIIVSWTDVGAGSVCLALENLCGEGPSFCLPIDVGGLTPEPEIDGANVICDGSVTTYTTDLVASATGYSWTTTCGTILSGQNTNTITIDWAGCPDGGSVCLSLQTDCGNSPTACFVVSGGTIPDAPVVSGLGDPCVGSSAQYCAMPDSNASSYSWAINGGLITAGQGTDCVTVTWTTPGAGTICAIAENGCGPSAEVCFDATVGSPPNAPDLDGPDQPCVDDISTYTITQSDPDVTGFSWTATNGGVILNGQGTNSIQVEWTQAGPAQVLVAAQNDCGDGAESFFDLVVIAYPTPDAGPNDGICGLSYGLNGALSSGTGVWSASGPGVASFSDINDPHTNVSVSAYGAYVFTWTETTVNCVAADSVTISFNPDPQISGAILEECTSDGQTYSVTFVLQGGQAPYSVTGSIGGFVTGNSFTSDLIASGVAYSFEVYDALGCGPIVITGKKTCDCVSDAGDLNLTPLSACDGQTVNVTAPANAVFDPTDTYSFIFHTDNGTNGNTLGTILQQNLSGQFGFVPGLMDYNTTYYISYAVGNDTGTGVDLNDDCTDVSLGVPVMFIPLPQAAFASDATVCEGDIASLPLIITSSTCVNISYQLSDGSSGFLACVETGDMLTLATGDASITVTMLTIIDQDGCFQAGNAVGTITVNTIPEATIVPTATICNSTDSGNPTTLDFSALITGGDQSGSWANTDGALVGGNFPALDFTGAIPGVYDFTYTTGAALPPCPQQSYVVQVTVEDCACPVLDFLPAPTLCNDAGLLNLNLLQVQANAGTYAVTSGPAGAVNYPQINGGQLDAFGADPGVYTLTFTLATAPPQGCPASATLLVTISAAMSAGTALPAVELCEGTLQTINLNALLSGADGGGVWTEISSIPSTGGAFNPASGTFVVGGQQASTYRFRYTVTPSAPCSADFEQVEVTIHPNPVADAGSDGLLTCNAPEISLGGNSSEGPGIVYQWTAAAGPFPGDAAVSHPAVSVPGVYTLTVTNTQTGCFATDATTIASSQEIPYPTITLKPISCYGKNDGAIIIDSITGGVPPYLVSINGGPFQSNTQFINLPPDTYTLVVEDANGCETDPPIIIDIQQPQEINVTLVAYLDGNTIRLGEAVVMEAQVNVPWTDIDTIIWQPSSLVDCDSCIRVTSMPFQTTTFSVTIESNGCSDSDALQIIVRKDMGIYAPNVFTPNADGENDLFMLFAGPEVAQIKSFTVFNRWGETVHQKLIAQPNDPSQGWDGMHRGKPLDPAVFTWFAEVEFIDGRLEIFKGDVSLVR